MKIQAILAAAAIAMSGHAAGANELIRLTNDDLTNSAIVSFQGAGNRLEIVQEHPGAGAGNTLSITIDGDFNGGPLHSSFSGAAMSGGLEPGTLMQEGYGNAMEFGITGNHNLFAAVQFGNNNTIDAVITGSYNQASVTQVGNGNFAAFSQTGIANTVSISQTSW